MSIDDEARQLSGQFIRMFFDLSFDIIDQIKYKIENTYDALETSKYKELKGKNYKNKNEMILNSRMKYQQIKMQEQVIRNNDKKLNRNQIKILKQLCERRGVDIYIEKCPDNLDQLVDNYKKGISLSLKEEHFLKAFTDRDDDGNITNVYHEGGVLMFNAQDINLMEDIIRDVEQKSLNIQKRKIIAKNKAEKMTKKVENFIHKGKER